MRCSRSQTYWFGRSKTYSVSTAQWLDIEESKDFVALEDLEGWDVTCFIEDQSRFGTV